MEYLYERTQQESELKVGDIVNIKNMNRREIYDHPSEWPNQWIDGMDRFIGDNRKIIKMYSAGIILKGAEEWFFPWFVLDKIKGSPKLPDKIKINQTNGYYIHFTSHGIIVGCQTISFRLLEQVYLKAKKVQDRKQSK